MKTRIILISLFLVFFVIGGNATETRPVAVSPGIEAGMAVVGRSCPTFSWSAVQWTEAYRVVVFKAVGNELLAYEEMEATAYPVLSKEIRGRALSWTPSEDERLMNGGEYVWYVQAVDMSGKGVWSEGRMFKVEEAVRLVGVDEKVRESLKEYGVSEETINNVLKDVKSGLREVAVHGSVATTLGQAGIQGTENADYTFYGLNAGASNTGDYNSFFGSSAGYSNTSGYSNTFIGHQAGYTNTSGYFNSFTGRSAGYSNTTGHHNSFFGCSAGFSNTTGNYNTFIGYTAGYSNTTGHQNTFIGRNAGFSNVSSDDNTFMGYTAGYSNTGDYNTFIGHRAGHDNTTGHHNTFIGRDSGYTNTTGNYNAILGTAAGYNNNTGHYNTFVGYGAGGSNSAGQQNTLLGYTAGYSTTGDGNVFLGYHAGYFETGSNKLYIDNSDTASPLIYGEFNNDIVAVNGSLGIGTHSPGATVEAEGTGSAVKFWLDRTDGATAEVVAKLNNITFGSRTNHGIQFSVNSVTRLHIDTNGDVGIGVTDATYPLEMGGGAYCTGTNWVDVSSREFKENITNLNTEEAFEALEGLNPVRFNYKKDAEEDYVGFIAEDVPELVAMKDRKSINTMDVVAVLTKVVQEQELVLQQQQKVMKEQQETDEEQKKLIQDQRKVIQEHQKAIAELNERVAALEKKK